MDIKNFVLSSEALGLIDNGTWVGELQGAPGVEFLVLGMRSEQVRKALEAEHAAARKANGGNALNAEQASSCLERVMATHVLRDWKGLTDGGEPLQYDKELAYKWMTNREGEKFAELVLQAVNKLDREANDLVESLAKN